MATRLQKLRHKASERPAVCEACGRHVPASMLATCEVEGLRGRDICPYCEGERRFAPSYSDLRREDAVEVPSQDDDLPRGGGVYWR